jgi:hypothetical protein
MDDYLLKRADLAIREGHIIRDQARDNLMQAKIATRSASDRCALGIRYGGEKSPDRIGNG